MLLAMIGDIAPNTAAFTDPRVTGLTTHSELQKYLDREWKYKALSLRGLLRFCLSKAKG